MEFFVEFRSTLPQGQLLGTRLLNTERTTLRVADAINAGFAGGTVGYRDYGASAIGYRIQDPVDLIDLADVTIWTDTDKSFLVYQGRVQDMDQPGGQAVRAFTLQGYGADAAKDLPFTGGLASEAAISGGELIRRAVQICAPLLTVGDPEQFIDPGGSYKPAENNGRYLGQIVDQIVKAGTDGASGVPGAAQMVYWVYEGRVIYMQPRTPPTDPDGFTTWDYQVMPDKDYFAWKRTGSTIVSGVAVEYQPLGSEGTVTDVVPNETSPILQYGLQRILQIPNATMEKAQAELLARSLAKRFGQPQVTATTMCDNRHVLYDRSGSRVPYWSVRSGQWLKVEGWDEPLMITSTDKDLSSGAIGKVTITASNSAS